LHRLIELLAPLYPDSSHVRSFGLQSADDEVIWELARRQDITLVSKDSEFHQRSFLFGFPPKIIWVRLGNCSTHEVAKMLRA
jgi:predicted nuclease of predicted toxin-antitoxin system